MGNRAFKENKKHLAFGMMRLPMIGDKIDNEQVCRMVDRFLERGFNYFDTAHGYIDGKSDWIDLRCAEHVELKAGEFKLLPLGIAIKLPDEEEWKRMHLYKRHREEHHQKPLFFSCKSCFDTNTPFYFL